jgi:adenosylcobyric acid synthase
MPQALMVLGTASHVGKSLVAAAFCRLLAERGGRVAPFKAQNMALNSFVTREGGEIGRAQVAQAEAAGVEPHTDMNPVLLKPMGGVSQVVVDGEPIGVMSAREYYAAKDRIWPRVTAAFDRLAARFDRIVLEGAGSPVEVNLAEHDLTNLRMARHADAAVVLVADIERGGVFAQVVGTLDLMPPEDRARVVGVIINKFRGDATLLGDGPAFLRARTGVPVLGVLPFRADLQVDQEDSLGIDATATPEGAEADPESLDVAVPRLPGLSNFTDLAPLARMPGVRLRYVERGEALGRPDLVLLPGTKTTARDLAWLRRVGLASRLEVLAREPDGPMVVGVCGGFQMLGTQIDDPEGAESDEAAVAGLGLLDARTRFQPDKARHLVRGATFDCGLPLVGYEIHMGRTALGPGARPFARLVRGRDGTTLADGGVSSCGRFLGTYVHGLFDSRPFAAWLVDRLRARRGLPPLGPSPPAPQWDAIAARYAGLAALLREHLDLAPVLASLGESSA